MEDALGTWEIKLNIDISNFPHVHPIEGWMRKKRAGIGRLVMLDRYAYKDLEKKTLKVGDFVILTVKEDPKFPARGFGRIEAIDWANNEVNILVEEEFRGNIVDPKEQETGVVTKMIDSIDKPLEIYWEQIAKRVARGLSEAEKPELRDYWRQKFESILMDDDFIPAGRINYGAGSGTDVTYYNCYVMPFPADSRQGLAEHRKNVMEIMSRGGGVGTNGSTLRPRNALAKGVNGKSSGAVTWMNDISLLTDLVQQGGSRRGAQMQMLADWHPDLLEFIISKMQNPDILRYIIAKVDDPHIKRLAQDKLKFTPLTQAEQHLYSDYLEEYENVGNKESTELAQRKLADGGTYSVNNPEFMSGANISICLTKEFMAAVENDEYYTLRFPDVENYNEEDKKFYNEKWHEIGDVREWEKMGYAIKNYRTIKASVIWDLINICATYSAEPGIFFYDTAREMSNASSYGQGPIATNPCGEQPLPAWSVCLLSAINLANMANKQTKTLDEEKLRRTVRIAIRFMDNVIDTTPYFIKKNEIQQKGERRLGLGEMGLADLLIYCELRYGSPEGNALVNRVHEIMAEEAYLASTDLAAEKGSFPFLKGATKEEELDNRYKFIETGYMRKMPDNVRKAVLKKGIRNSHAVTVAPTGSTGTMVGVATGLEPYFAFEYYRNGRLGAWIKVAAPIVQEYLDAHPEATIDNLPSFFVSSMELAPEDHVTVQCIIQRWVDSSISKTVNAPKGYTVKQVQAVYEQLWRGGAKGGTVYVDGSRSEQVLNLIEKEESEEPEAKVDWKVDMADAQLLSQGEKKIGTDIGDTCPVCQVGEVIDAGGCHTCNNCQSQLLCGL